MDYIKIGKIVNTHGIKGELRILSDFKQKNLVFQKGFIIYIGPQKEQHIISGYRYHKIFDMITLEGFSNINEVLPYKGLDIYIEKNSLSIIYDEDYIGLDVYTDHKIGKIVDVIHNINQDLLVVEKDGKRYFVPNVDAFVDSIDLKNHKITIHEIKGLFDEN